MSSFCRALGSEGFADGPLLRQQVCRLLIDLLSDPLRGVGDEEDLGSIRSFWYRELLQSWDSLVSQKDTMGQAFTIFSALGRNDPASGLSGEGWLLRLISPGFPIYAAELPDVIEARLRGSCMNRLSSQLDLLEFLYQRSRDDIRYSWKAFLVSNGCSDDVSTPLLDQNVPYLACLNALDAYRGFFKFQTALPLASRTGLGEEGCPDELELPKADSFSKAMGWTVFKSNYWYRFFPKQSQAAKSFFRRLYTRMSENRNIEHVGLLGPTQRALKLLFNLLRLKEIAPPVSYAFFKAELEGHRDSLSKPQPDLGGDSAFERVSIAVVNAIIPEVIRYQDLPPARFSDRAGLIKTWETEGDYQRLRSGEGIRARLRDQLLNIRQQVDLLAVGPETSSYTFVRELDPVDLFDQCERVPAAMVVGLMEPLKVRTISVGDAVVQSIGSRVQKFLWKTLKEIPCFALIGGMSVEDALLFLDRPGLPREVHGERMGFVSGDYKGATDTIPLKRTRFLADQVLRRFAMPDPVRQALLDSLCQTSLDYSGSLTQMYQKFGKLYLESRGIDTRSRDFKLSSFADELADVGIFPTIDGPLSVRQASGQLMGNILSFPLLCLVNLICYLCCIEDFGAERTSVHHDSPGIFVWDRSRAYGEPCVKTITVAGQIRLVSDRRMIVNPRLRMSHLNTLRLLVNGDDILFSATTALYNHWSANIGRFGGFVKSVGKNYFSPHFFTVNSQLFVPPPAGRWDQLRQIRSVWIGGLRPDFVRSRFEFAAMNGGAMEYNEDPRLALQAVQGKLLDSVEKDCVEPMNRLFFEMNKPLLDVFRGTVEGFVIPWFVPIPLGGLGLRSCGMAVPELTTQQKLLVGKMHLVARDPSAHAPRLFTTPLDQYKSELTQSLRESGRVRYALLPPNWVIKTKTGYLDTRELWNPEFEEWRERELSSLGSKRAGPLQGTTRSLRSLEHYLQIQLTGRDGPSWLALGPDAFGEKESGDLPRRVDKLFQWALRVNRRLAAKFKNKVLSEYPVTVAYIV